MEWRGVRVVKEWRGVVKEWRRGVRGGSRIDVPISSPSVAKASRTLAWI